MPHPWFRLPFVPLLRSHRCSLRVKRRALAPHHSMWEGDVIVRWKWIRACFGRLKLVPDTEEKQSSITFVQLFRIWIIASVTLSVWIFRLEELSSGSRLKVKTMCCGALIYDCNFSLSSLYILGMMHSVYADRKIVYSPEKEEEEEMFEPLPKMRISKSTSHLCNLLGSEDRTLRNLLLLLLLFDHFLPGVLWRPLVISSRHLQKDSGKRETLLSF